MDRILLKDFIDFISSYIKIDSPYIKRKEYYYEYEYNNILPGIDMILRVKHRDDISYVGEICFKDWENNWNFSRRWISLELYHNKNGIYSIFFQVSNALCNKDWIKKINSDIPTDGQCYLDIYKEEHNIYCIILNYLKEINPGYMRELQIKSVID